MITCKMYLVFQTLMVKNKSTVESESVLNGNDFVSFALGKHFFANDTKITEKTLSELKSSMKDLLPTKFSSSNQIKRPPIQTSIQNSVYSMSW